jgi:transcriptional regulator with XRE-family HTH domain
MRPTQPDWIDSMAANDRQFFIDLGRRIAALRKEQHLTQQQLADALGIAQQTLAHYEGGRIRAPASMLPQLAHTFGVGIDELVGHPSKNGGKRGPAPKLQRQLERVSQLPKPQQRFVEQMLETVLAQASR